ncbi:hypothetical protein [Limnohabitans sp. G3-2]|uniref:hypothetical protein n=1 Tax=Limnohabitans sp. G3-2 TaxID=1100711 RepID=UPI000C1E9FB7|nr:hypothetical protein [Limnohabitans sp. G3-2]PIT73906.1 hypothetical protein B9Z31_08560 [Limnohabitans sp. G3-2]
MNRSDLTIVVNTCDAYQDVLEVFFCALKAHWPDCPYPVVINTESNTHDYPARVHNHRSQNGVDDWGDRLRQTLNSIDTEFVLMLYDDFILDGPVSNERIINALNLLRSQAQAVVTYLMNTSLPLSQNDTHNTFIALKDRVDYRLNSAPGIWRRQALIEYTAPGDTPWAWEVFGSYRTWRDGKIFYSLNPQQPDIYPYNHDKGGAIYRGKWVREVVEKVAKNFPLKIDWSERGFSSDTVFEKRTTLWKLRFMQTGFRMVGWKAMYFVMGYVRDKLHVR